MYVQINAAIVDPDAANRQELAGFLGAFGVNVIAQLPSLDQVPQVLGRVDAPQLVIVNLDPGPQESLRKLGNLPRQHPAVSFFVMSQVLDPNLLMEAMHLGVREFVPVPIQEQKFAAAIERLASQHGMGKKARFVHVIPTIGGCGSTTVACNIAASLAKSGARTVLGDLDLIRGGAASYFDIRPRYTIADVMASADKVDKQLLDNALAIHRNSGLAILARPELPEDSQRASQQGLQRLLNVLGRMYDFVVLDSVMSIDPLYATAIQASDLNLIIMQLNVPSCRNAERFVGALRRMGIESSKMRIIVNRYVKKGWDIEPEEVERALGLKISWLVPNDFKNAIAAINFGEPVVLRSPRSEMSQSLMELAESLRPVQQAARNAA
ncbi:MAG: AAA family ATPase [Phycisphaerae bacterium]|nr:AAA family ATPase [Phycisphaerae bacterium]MDW8260912.1 AAA family ATPase [Phycisphaerales bacterium]